MAPNTYRREAARDGGIRNDVGYPGMGYITVGPAGQPGHVDSGFRSSWSPDDPTGSM